MSKFKFSIIIPIFNTPKELLVSCFNSVSNQSFYDYEVIIINDGSTLECKKNIEELSKCFDDVIVINKTNEGVSKARNVGIQKATGEYIIFIDADNTLPDDTLKIYSENIEKAPDLIIGLSVLGSRIIKDGVDNINIDNQNINENNNDYYKQINNKEELINHLLTGRLKKFYYKNGYFADGPCGKLFRTEIAKKIEFPENLKWDEDTIWLLEFIKNCNKIIYLRKHLYNTIEFEYSATRKFRENCLNEFIDVCIAEDKLNSYYPACKSAFAYKKFSNVLLLARVYFFHKNRPFSNLEAFDNFKKWAKFGVPKEMFIDILFKLDYSSMRNIFYKIFSLAMVLHFYKICFKVLGKYVRK